MNHLVREKPDIWDNRNLSNCFVSCMRNLWISLQKESIQDTFYPEVKSQNFHHFFFFYFSKLNLLDRLEHKIVSECCKFLDNVIKKHSRTGDLKEFFPSL